MNAIISLAPSSFGPVLMEKLVSSGEILEISAKMIRPFYQDKCKRALEWVHLELEGIPYRVHTPEGSMFLWLWFENLPITSEELYLRLKEHGVLVVSGHYFFPGLKQDWQHSSECVRLTYSQDDETVQKGIAIIGRVLKDIYQEK
jgi:valine--pyruvate aminotransferase